MAAFLPLGTQTWEETMQFIAGNWKMNGLMSSLREIESLVTGLRGRASLPEILVCPPATLLQSLSPVIVGSPIKLGGQTCHATASGAHTGDISAEMLRDAGASYVIVGHSERRTDHGETSSDVAAQAAAARRAGLSAIVCIGESEAQRNEGGTEKILAQQIQASITADSLTSETAFAYEPIWAIGTGKTASLNDIDRIHAFIRARLDERFGLQGRNARLLYGGSVKPSNAREILNLASVDGVLVGGASLKADEFLAIIDGSRG